MKLGRQSDPCAPGPLDARFVGPIRIDVPMALPEKMRHDQHAAQNRHGEHEVQPEQP